MHATASSATVAILDAPARPPGYVAHGHDFYVRAELYPIRPREVVAPVAIVPSCSHPMPETGVFTIKRSGPEIRRPETVAIRLQELRDQRQLRSLKVRRGLAG